MYDAPNAHAWRMPPLPAGSMASGMMGMANLGSTITFNDPSLVGGGGLTVFVSRHWTVRPEILATVVLRDSRNFVVTTGAVRLAYHFEDHPVTP